MSRYSGGTDKQFWIMAWDGKPYVVDRMGRPPVELDHLLIGVMGGLQPDKLAEVFKGAADGLYARFLFAWPPTPPYRPLTDRVEEIDQHVVDAFDQLSRLPARTSNRLPLTPKARAEFEILRRQVSHEARALYGRERDWWAKAPSHALRLAGTLCLLRWAFDGGGREPRDIKYQYLTAAVHLVRDYFWPHARAALRQIGLSQRHVDARRVLRWIAAKDRDEVSREDIRRYALGQSRDADETQGILDGLTRAGWLRQIRSATGRQGGRPSLRWQVNPKLWE